MLAELLLDTPVDEFLVEILSKAPLARPSTAGHLTNLFTWENFATLAPKIPEKEVLVVKNGKLFPHLVPKNQSDVKLFHQDGFSIVLRHTERFDDQIARLAKSFSDELRGEIVVQIYSTPAGFHSFGWHYDAEDVFIIQMAGEKDYFLRENTVNPYPRLETMPDDMHYEKEITPIMGTTLIAGDFLHIPSGWWHVAQAKTDSLSLSIGLTR